jgi:hypothetical protein
MESRRQRLAFTKDCVGVSETTDPTEPRASGRLLRFNRGLFSRRGGCRDGTVVRSLKGLLTRPSDSLFARIACSALNVSQVDVTRLTTN